MITACGDTSNKFTLPDGAMDTLTKYVSGEGSAPTIATYESLGIQGINEKNIDELNLFLTTLAEEDIDTIEELKAIIDALGFSLASDTTPPTITINGDNPLTIFLHDYYEKKCATAIDEHDGHVIVYALGEVNTSKVGTYIIKYSAVDTANNLAEAERIVHVIDNTSIDTTPPTITLSGSSTISLFLHDTYNEEGATALDDRDGNITSNILTSNPVDTTSLGTYIVTYDVNDSAGNAATQVTRTVEVILPPDTTPPSFTSPHTIHVQENQTYATTLVATDESPVSYSISGTDAHSLTLDSTTGVINFNVAPDYESAKTSYEFIATAHDTSSNTSQMTVTITILDVDGLSGCWEQISTPVLDINQSASAELASMVFNKDMDTHFVAWTEGTWDNANYYVKSYDGSNWSTLGDKLNNTALSAWPRVVIKSAQGYSVGTNTPYAYFRNNDMKLKHWDGSVWQEIYSTNEYYLGDYDMAISDYGSIILCGMQGDYDLHFKKYDGSSWVDLPWIHSGNNKAFIHPILTMKQDENPFLITGYTDNYTHTLVYDYNGTAWNNLGYLESNSTTRQTVCASMIMSQSGHPTIAYVEQDLPNQGSGNKKIYVKQYNGGTWNILGDALNGVKEVNTNGGLESGSGYNQCISLAEDYNGNLHIAWQHEAYGKKGIIIQKYNTQSLSWEEPSNMLKDEESVRAPSLTIDSSGFVTLTALYDSTPGETDADDVKMYRCVNAPSIQYHVNINVLDPYGNPTYMDLNVTSHTNNDFMAIHSYGLYTFATTFLDNTYYEIEVETLPYADHPECIFIDENLANLGTYLYGKIESSDANLTIDCSGNSLAKKL